jgi:hypothetical protein
MLTGYIGVGRGRGERAWTWTITVMGQGRRHGAQLGSIRVVNGEQKTTYFKATKEKVHTCLVLRTFFHSLRM